MLIYIVRHAIAVPRELHVGLDDAARELTEKGVERMHQIVRGLDGINVVLDEIWTSPLIRARQTADILAGARHFRGSVRPVAALAPGGDPTQIVRELATVSPQAAIALVGHEPDLGELAALLLTGRSQSFLEFKKGGVACIELESNAPPRGTLRWLMTPRQMRNIH